VPTISRHVAVAVAVAVAVVVKHNNFILKRQKIKWLLNPPCKNQRKKLLNNQSLVLHSSWYWYWYWYWYCRIARKLCIEYFAVCFRTKAGRLAGR
jgi:hypothetical protein